MNEIRPNSPTHLDSPWGWFQKSALLKITQQLPEGVSRSAIISTYTALCHIASNKGESVFSEPLGEVSRLSGGLDRKTLEKAFVVLEVCGLLIVEKRYNSEKKQWFEHRYSLLVCDDKVSDTYGNHSSTSGSDSQTSGNAQKSTTPQFLKNKKNLKNNNNPKSSISEDCEKIYQLYPKKVGRGSALKAIRKALKTVSFEILYSKVSRYAESRVGEDSTFTPNPASWFNDQRWEDDESTWFQGKTSSRDVSGLEVLSETDEEIIYKDPSSNDGMRKVKK